MGKHRNQELLLTFKNSEGLREKGILGRRGIEEHAFIAERVFFELWDQPSQRKLVGRVEDSMF